MIKSLKNVNRAFFIACILCMMTFAFAAPNQAQVSMIKMLFGKDGMLRNIVAFIFMAFGGFLTLDGIMGYIQSKSSDNGEQAKTGTYRAVVGLLVFFAPYIYDILNLETFVNSMFP